VRLCCCVSRRPPLWDFWGLSRLLERLAWIFGGGRLVATTQMPRLAVLLFFFIFYFLFFSNFYSIMPSSEAEVSSRRAPMEEKFQLLSVRYGR